MSRVTLIINISASRQVIKTQMGLFESSLFALSNELIYTLIALLFTEIFIIEVTRDI